MEGEDWEQRDGNLIFGDQILSGCRVFPHLRSKKNLLEVRVSDSGVAVLFITDLIVWKLDEESCYPDTFNTCYSQLFIGQRISWKDFI